MKKLILLIALIALALPNVTLAHRSGCHRWHSCPSDTGSYVCGDLGYSSGCPQKYVAPIIPRGATGTYFFGTPKNRTDLLNCYVVGNKTSRIYHMRGSSQIRGMVATNKEGFLTESTAILKGYRKSKS